MTKYQSGKENVIGWYEFIRSIIGLFIMGLWIYGFPIGCLIFNYGGSIMQIILILLLPYQYFFCKRNHSFVQLLMSLQPFKFFKSTQVIFESELDDSNCLIAVVPHGITSIGANILFYQDQCQKRKFHLTVSRMALYNPWGGIFQLLLGTLPVNPNNLARIMKKGSNFIILPGSFEEATITRYNVDNVFIEKRKGFVKYALRYGYKIYPCYSFGEKNLYKVYSPPLSIGFFLNRLKIPAIAAFGSFLIYPFRDAPMNIVVGKPIQCPQYDEPSDQEVIKYHRMFVNEIQRIYDHYGPSFGSPNKLLIF